jgi:hypothetical protein
LIEGLLPFWLQTLDTLMLILLICCFSIFGVETTNLGIIMRLDYILFVVNNFENSSKSEHLALGALWEWATYSWCAVWRSFVGKKMVSFCLLDSTSRAAKVSPTPYSSASIFLSSSVAHLVFGECACAQQHWPEFPVAPTISCQPSVATISLRPISCHHQFPAPSVSSPISCHHEARPIFQFIRQFTSKEIPYHELSRRQSSFESRFQGFQFQPVVLWLQDS